MAQAPPSPVSAATPCPPLYSHAIESILAFCTLRELAAALTINHQWSQAVRTMAPISGTASRRVLPIRLVSKASPLRRHIVHIAEVEAGPAQSSNAAHEDSDDEEVRKPSPPPVPLWTAVELELLVERVPRLQSLHADLKLLPQIPPPVVIPAGLRGLRIAFRSGDEPLPDHDPQPLRVIESIAALPGLTSLDFDLGREEWSLASLIASPSLLHLTLRWRSPRTPDAFDLTADNRLIIRSMSRLMSLQLWGPSSTGVVRLLCARGHSMRSLQSLRLNDSILWWGEWDGEEEPLASVLSLTELDLSVQNDQRLPTFVGELPLLRTLRISFRESFRDGDDIARCLLPCRALTSLDLASAKLSSAHLTSILELNPSITRLSLSDMRTLESLAFLDSVALRSSLRSLTLESCVGLLIADLASVDALRALQELRLFYSFIEGVSAEVERCYKLPCKRIPTLRLFKAMSPLF